MSLVAAVSTEGVLLACACFVLLPLVLAALLLLWPLLLCWHLGHPLVGIFAQMLWVVVLDRC